MGGICLVSVYQCFYKPKLRSSTFTAVGGHDESHSQREFEGVMGSGDAIVYDVVDERPRVRVGAVLEMRENEAYSVNKRVQELEMNENKSNENEAYSVSEQVKGLEMKENEAYGVTKKVGEPEMKEDEAYGVAKRVNGLEMKENEAYGITNLQDQLERTKQF